MVSEQEDSYHQEHSPLRRVFISFLNFQTNHGSPVSEVAKWFRCHGSLYGAPFMDSHDASLTPSRNSSEQSRVSRMTSSHLGGV